MDNAMQAAESSIGRVDLRWRPERNHLPEITQIVSPDSPEPERQRLELVQRMSAMQEIHLRMARESFGAFMEYCFIDGNTGLPFRQQWFHDMWSDAMDTGNRLMMIAPRNHGKTSQIIGRTIYELGRDQNLRVKIACASDGRAKERLFEVSQNVLYNKRIQEVFPQLTPDPNATWNVHKIHVRRNARHRDASIEALGITATATGGRCDLLIADDVVDRRNALSFPALREQIKLAWLADWTNLLEPDSRIWDICTLWHKDDLNHMLMENPAYRTLFLAIDDKFGSIWPGKWPEAELRARHLEIGTVEFNRGFRNQAIDLETQTVKPGWFKFKSLRNDPEFMERYRSGAIQFLNSYDTAGTPTGNADQDYYASVVAGVDAERRKVYIVDAWHARASLKQMSRYVNEEFIRYSPFKTLIEKIGQSSLDEWVLNDYPEMSGNIEITRPRVSKAIRLLAVTPLMEMGNVIFDEHLNPSSELWDPSRGNIYDELIDFPFGRHDDLTDAFSQVLDGARRYFLDAWANQGQNIINLNVGGIDERTQVETSYLF